MKKKERYVYAPFPEFSQHFKDLGGNYTKAGFIAKEQEFISGGPITNENKNGLIWHYGTFLGQCMVDNLGFNWGLSF